MEISFFKALITLINIVILARLPIRAWQCRSFMFKQEHGTFEWGFTIVFTMVWVTAMGAEIPALLVRYLSYYEFKIQLPQVLYVLNLWDRWHHLTLYLFLELLTHMWLTKKMPKIVPSVFG